MHVLTLAQKPSSKRLTGFPLGVQSPKKIRVTTKKFLHGSRSPLNPASEVVQSPPLFSGRRLKGGTSTKGSRIFTALCLLTFIGAFLAASAFALQVPASSHASPSATNSGTDTANGNVPPQRHRSRSLKFEGHSTDKKGHFLREVALFS